jgi:hypothetical protein
VSLPRTAVGEEASGVRRFWTKLGLPGLIDVHTHFMPESVLRKVWDYFDAAGPLIGGMEWPITYRTQEAERAALLREFGVRAFTSMLYRSWAVSGSESSLRHAPNGLGRTGPPLSPPGGDTDRVRGPVPGGRNPSRPGPTSGPTASGEGLNHHSGGAGAPLTDTAPGVPARGTTLTRPRQAAQAPAPQIARSS